MQKPLYYLRAVFWLFFIHSSISFANSSSLSLSHESFKFGIRTIELEKGLNQDNLPSLKLDISPVNYGEFVKLKEQRKAIQGQNPLGNRQYWLNEISTLPTLKNPQANKLLHSNHYIIELNPYRAEGWVELRNLKNFASDIFFKYRGFFADYIVANYSKIKQLKKT